MAGRSEKTGVPAAVNWKTNLAALWATQFLSLAAFSFCLPFMPLYLQRSGIVPGDQAAHWSGILQSVSSVSMIVMSPVWGMLGDRYGRKMMLVRANLAGGFVLYLMGVVDNIEALIVLRILHGAFTGTIAAAQALVATNTPDRNQGFALGLIMAAVSAGQTAGNYCGGMCAKYFGPVVSFKVGGVMLAISTILVVGWVKESFARPPVLPAPSQSARIRRRRDGIRSFKAGLPILGVVCLVSFLQVFDSPYLSLYIDSLYRIPVLSAVARGLAVSGGWGTEMVSTVDDALTSQVYGITGWVSAIASIAAMAGSIAAGKIMDRRLPVAVWLLLAAGGVAGALVCGTVPTMVGMVVGRSFFLFIVSGLASAVIVVLGRMTPNAKRGAAMGWSQTARSIGWSVSPLLGAFTAQRFGWDAAYLLLAVSSCLLLPCFWYLHRRYALAFQPLDDDLPSMGMVGGSHVAAPGGQGRL